MINLELYRAFYMVATTGSLTAAAKEMFISQPALSQSIANLEKQIGGSLFVRTQKGMVLTPEGNEMYAYVERALHMLEAAQNRFEEMKHLVVGSIRIGASDTLCRYFLLPHISRFHELYSDVNIQVTNRTSPETLSLLRAGKVDLAFVNLPLGEDEFQVSPCMSLQDCFVGTKKYVTEKPRNVAEMSRLPLVMIEPLSNTRQHLDRYMQGKGVKLTPEFELGSFDLVVEFAKAELGIGFVTREFVRKELENEELFEIPTTFALPSRAVGSVVRRDMPMAFAAERFMDIVNGKCAM
jgi:Transcriptional regulator